MKTLRFVGSSEQSTHRGVRRSGLLDAIQGQMIKVFLGQDPRMQARGGQSAVDDRGRHPPRGLPSGVLRADETMNEETGRFNGELFSDVFADRNQIVPALSAGERFRFVAMVDARQFRWRDGTPATNLIEAWEQPPDHYQSTYSLRKTRQSCGGTFT